MLKRSLTLLTLLTMVLLAGPATADSASPSGRAAAKAVPVRLYVLECGYLRTIDPTPYGITAPETALTDMAAPCYLIRHGKDWMLFDAGLGDAHVGRTDMVRDMTLDVPRTLVSQLKALGLTPTSIGRVAISHFHFDHIGNIAEFPKAELMIQRPEFERMRKDPYPYTPDGVNKWLAGEHIQLLDGDFDVFGDGTVRLISTPGHSVGHQSLLLTLANTGPVLLTGDLWHYPAEMTLHRVPPREAASATPASRERIEAMVRAARGQIWIEHDLALYRTQRHAPAFYD